MKGKTLITGASGLLGRAVLKHWWDRGDLVVGQGFNRLVYRGVRLDLLDLLHSNVILKMLELGGMIHCAAERRPDRAQQFPEQTRALNVDVPRVLAKFCKEQQIPFIYISTDYVFDGTQAPYSPKDVPNPLNYYGQSKLDGEKAVLEAYPEAKILRVPVLYGPVEEFGECAISAIVQGMLKSEESFHDAEAERYPTHVCDVAEVLYQMMAQYERLDQSIYHWSSEEAWTKFEIAQMVQRQITRFKNAKVFPEKPQPDRVDRPQNCQLYRGDLEKLGIKAHRDFRQEFVQIVLTKLREMDSL